jgi:hypothetical protein
MRWGVFRSKLASNEVKDDMDVAQLTILREQQKIKKLLSNFRSWVTITAVLELLPQTNPPPDSS